MAANQQVLYTLLFRCVAQTLQEFAADPQYGLGGQIGFTAVLHTWDQKLLYHVHLHCVIAGGALGLRWQSLAAGTRQLSFPRSSLVAGFPCQVPRRRAEGVRRGATDLSWPARVLGDTGTVPGASGAIMAEGLGGLFSASVRGSGQGARLPQPLHASDRHQQPSSAQAWKTAG